MLIYLLCSFGSIYLLWLFYLAVMNLKRAKDAGTISKIALYFGYPILFIGLLLDALVNIFVFSVIFLDPPEEFTTTKRLSRYIICYDDWRYSLALWFCGTLLDTFDPSGKHCK